MDEFEKELKAGFLDEAGQLLVDVEQCFLSLESTPEDSTLLDKIFRLAHNLKGSANAVGFEQMGAFAHVFESFLLKIKNGQVAVSSAVVSLLLRCNDHLNKTVNTLKADMSAKTDDPILFSELEAAVNNGVADTPKEPATGEAAAEMPALSDQPSAEEVGALLAQETDERLEAVIAAPSPVAAPVPASPSAALPPEGNAVAASGAKTKAAAATDESIRVSLARLERLLNFVGEMVILQTVLREQVTAADPTLLRRTVHQLGKVTKEVQDISMSLRMVPIKQTFQKMQRIVRDTAGALGKKVQFSLDGEETELDKTVLEKISDPLVHLIRNAVDHGIESSDMRVSKGKPAEGSIFLSAGHQGGKLVIEIRDDGGGINPEILRQKAKEKGVIPANSNLSDREAVHLVFHPGFSTKQEVTDVSGRGVGMDVVKTNIEALQGEILIETEVGKGTCFKVVLPLTLAIIDGMIVRNEDERFVIPLAQVHESLQPKPSQVQQNVGIGEVLILRDECLPLIRLGLGLGRKSTRPAHECIAIVVRTTARPFAILVDDILGQHQVVVKKLGSELERLKVFSGSAVLGDGRPALIIEPSELAALAPIMISKISSTVMEGMAS